MVNHAEASRLNIERMKQIYQQLSRYRGLGLLASVPSTHNGNGNGMAYSPGEQQPGSNTPAPAVSGSSVASGNRSGSILLNFGNQEHQGPSGIQQQEQQQQQQLGYHHMPDSGQTIPSSRLYQCNISHDMAGPQHSGSVTGKRERETERDIEGEDDCLSTFHKLQRQIEEVTSVHATSGNQSSMKS